MIYTNGAGGVWGREVTLRRDSTCDAGHINAGNKVWTASAGGFGHDSGYVAGGRVRRGIQVAS